MALHGIYTADAVFIAIYALLLGPAAFNVFRHGFTRTAGFIFLFLFCAIRLAGNICMVYAYETNFKNINVVIAGFILQGLGYGFLINTGLALYFRARSMMPNASEQRTRQTSQQRLADHAKQSDAPAAGASSIETRLLRLTYVINTVALILVIVGFSDSDIFTSAGDMPGSTSASKSSRVKLNAEVQAGVSLFLVLTIALAGFVAYTSWLYYHHSSSQGLQSPRDGKLVLAFTAAALPFLIVRSAYFVYAIVATNPLDQPIGLQIGLEFVMEVIAVSILTCLGFAVPRHSPSRDEKGGPSNAA